MLHNRHSALTPDLPLQVMPSKKAKLTVGNSGRNCLTPLWRTAANPTSHRANGFSLPRQPQDSASHATRDLPDIAADFEHSTEGQSAAPASEQPAQRSASLLVGPAGVAFRLTRSSFSLSRRARPNRNTARSVNWERAHPHLLKRRICAEARAADQRTAIAEALKAEVQRRVSAAVVFCECGARACTSPAEAPILVELVHIQGTVEVQLPKSVCQHCQPAKVIDPQPTDLGYFPATPSAATIWYDEQLLVLVSQIRLRCATAFASLTTALAALHDVNALSSRPAVWTHLQEACLQWLKLEQQMRDPAAYRVAPLQGCEGHHNCPACFRTCPAAIFDSCLGLTRFNAAARSSHAVQPSLHDPRMIADEEVKEALQQRPGLRLDDSQCSKHTAASVHGRRWE